MSISCSNSRIKRLIWFQLLPIYVNQNWMRPLNERLAILFHWLKQQQQNAYPCVWGFSCHVFLIPALSTISHRAQPVYSIYAQPHDISRGNVWILKNQLSRTKGEVDPGYVPYTMYIYIQYRRYVMSKHSLEDRQCARENGREVKRELISSCRITVLHIQCICPASGSTKPSCSTGYPNLCKIYIYIFI